MSATQGYLDLDLILTRHGEATTLLLDSPAGDRAVGVALSLSDLLGEAQALAGLSGWGEPGAEAAAQRWGEALFGALFAGGRGMLDAARALAGERGKGLRLRVRSDDPAIQSLPWEFLHDGSDFLALDRQTPLVRFLHVEQPRPSLVAGTLPLRLLVVMATPREVQSLELEQEWQRLYGALEPLVEEGLIVVERLLHATRERLAAALLDGYQLLHYVGHGHVDPVSGEGSLLLEDEEGLADPVVGSVLARWLRNAGLRMIFLNACDTARRAPAANRVTGLAQQLVAAGAGAVVAHQFPLADRMGIAFATSFYRALASGYPIEGATSIARAIVSEDIAWGTPVLFLRAEDGRLFDRASLSSEEAERLRHAGIRQRLQDAIEMEAWSTILPTLRRLADRFPDDVALREELRRYEEADQLLEQAAILRPPGGVALARLLLGQAKMKLGRVNYRDVEGRIREAEQRRHPERAPAPAPERPASPLSAAAQGQVEQLLSALAAGLLVPFVGSDANLCGRAGEPWRAGALFPPTTSELAEHLAGRFPFPGGSRSNLAHVAQYMTWMRSAPALQQELGALYREPLQPTPLHELLVRLVAAPRALPPSFHLTLILSTYDDVLEQSLRAHGVAFHLLAYEPGEGGGGRFRHLPPGSGEGELVLSPNRYDLPADALPVLIRTHGSPLGAAGAALVTEDQFIAYAPREAVQELLPHAIRAQVVQSHFLFLGYTLQDWPLRLILHRLASRQRSLHSWAVVDSARDGGLIPWDAVGSVRQIEGSLDDVVAEIEARLQAPGGMV